MKPLLLLLALSACTVRPDIGPIEADDGPAPVLLTRDAIAARTGNDLTDVETQESLRAKGAALRARADALR
ncbi:hypothetical protein [Falsirhodobacter sp. alg1]|uniref:hypothetical protein n=1 Tax=Falsirhodobacter sp. alg1 TaxID=1472418 RepID=UPI0005EDA32E|nr:hypothetical protein [Falsirhodobacter sp. alg1]